MKASLYAIAAALCLCARFAAATDQPAANGARVADKAALEHQLEDARARLEKAAKEVAELSVGMASDAESMRLFAGHAAHPFLGVQLGEPAAGGGVRIVSVSPGGPAATAGFKSGDIILSVNGKAVSSPHELANDVHQLPPDVAAVLVRLRDGNRESVEVVPRTADPRLELLLGDGAQMIADIVHGQFDRERGNFGSGWGELELAALSPELGHYFGTDKGVLVIRTPATLHDTLKDGDVIHTIDGREPLGVGHALRILHSYQPGERVTLAIERDHKMLSIEMTMPGQMREMHGPRAPRVPAPPAPPAPPGSGSSGE